MALEAAQPLDVVVLAAGRGKRFPGIPSKVLARLCDRTLVEHVLDTLSGIASQRVVVVVGHGREAVMGALRGRDLEFADQGEPLGTGHAVLAARPLLGERRGTVLVLNGDVPLVRRETLARLALTVSGGEAAAGVLTAELDEAGAYGRVLRNGDGSVRAIVEAADADPATLAVREINVGAYAFRAGELFEILASLRPDNAQQEIYLTDVVRVLVERGERVLAVPVGDALEASGINTPGELEALERALRSNPSRRS